MATSVSEQQSLPVHWNTESTISIPPPRYGDGLSEINLGRSLHALSARPIIATKVTLEDADLGDLSAAVEHSVESSLSGWGVRKSKLSTCTIGIGADRAASANIGSGILLSIDDVLGDRGVAEGLSRLRQRGLVRVMAPAPSAVRFRHRFGDRQRHIFLLAGQLQPVEPDGLDPGRRQRRPGLCGYCSGGSAPGKRPCCSARAGGGGTDRTRSDRSKGRIRFSAGRVYGLCPGRHSLRAVQSGCLYGVGRYFRFGAT